LGIKRLGNFTYKKPFMTIENQKMAVGVFANRKNLELALAELKAILFPLEKISVVVNDPKPEDNTSSVQLRDNSFNKTDRVALKGAVAGSALGSVTGLLVGLGILAIPGLGVLTLIGAEAAMIVGIISGAAAVSLIGKLIGLGIPEEQAKAVSDRLLQGQYLMLINGTETDILAAKVILNLYNIQEWKVYDSPSKKQAI
jgi:hypothetical protein